MFRGTGWLHGEETRRADLQINYKIWSATPKRLKYQRFRPHARLLAILKACSLAHFQEANPTARHKTRHLPQLRLLYNPLGGR